MLDTSLGSLCRAYVNSGDRSAASRLLNELATITAVTCRRHPLGFLHYDLGRRDVDQFRLHIWPEVDRIAQDAAAMVHDHVFDLESRVIVGCVTNHVYEVKAAADGACAMYSVTYQGSESRMTRSEGLFRAISISSGEHPAGAQYRLTAGTFHRSDVAPKTFCATLVVARYPSPPISGPRVLADADGEPLRTFDRAELASEQARQYLTQASSLLGAS